jgi:GT2 family glycosyltransferase
MAKKKLSQYTGDTSEEQTSSSEAQTAPPEKTEKMQAPDLKESDATRDVEALGTAKRLSSPVNSVSVPPDGKAFFNQVGPNQVKLDAEELKKMNVFFATPCYGGLITDQYFLSMFKLSQAMIQNGINFRITTLRNESLIPRARNILTAMFMDDPNATHLMFIDADIEFEPDAVLRMLAMNKNITAAAYPKKTVDWNGVSRAVERKEEDPAPFGAEYAINLKFADKATKKVNSQDGAVEVLDASTGFFMIKKEVIQTMFEAYPDLHYKNDSSIDPRFNKYCYSLFDTIHDPRDNRYLSEDYTFCRRWQALGGKIWVDPNTKLNHVGSFTFQGNLNKIFNYGP